MEKRTERTRQLFAGAGLTLGLVALGLYVSGDSARALSLVTPGTRDGGFFVPAGSASVLQRLQVNGKPATVRVCTNPSRSAGSILEAYRRVAEDETLAKVPYVFDERPDGGGTLVWAAPDGVRKAVVVEPRAGGGSEFRLIREESPLAEGRELPREAKLPGGLLAPPGFAVGFCMTHPDGTGTAVLEASGRPRDVAAGLISELRGARFEVDRAQLSDYEDAAAAHGNNTRLTLPFVHASGTLSGLVIVTRTQRGSRACLTVRGSR